MLIDASVSGLAAAGLPGSLLALGGAPCLKWKLAAAFKTHWGWNGFDSSISPPNKYLTKSVLYSQTATVAGQTTFSHTLTAQTIDRISGQVSGTPPPFGEGPITGGAPVVFGGDTQQLTDTGVVVVGSNATLRQSWRVNLSNQYTLAMLEGDVDALLDGFNPDLVPNQTITPLAYPTESNSDAGILAVVDLVPNSYPILITPTYGSPMPQPSLAAAAISAYNPNIFPQDFGTSGMGKVISFLTMAGAYCLKTFTVTLDDQGEHLIGTPACVSGRGSCSQWFKVTPPSPIVPGKNTYVMAVPNCRCGQ